LRTSPARGVLYLTPEARFSYLRDLPEGANLGRALNNAMSEIETSNPELADTLPKIIRRSRTRSSLSS
jgi:type I restriction enzyme M protein